MRGLSTAATLILAPTAALTRPVPTNPSLRDVPTESAFTVAVAVDTSASGDARTVDQTLVFNLDIQESPEACAPAKVRIDGFLLAQDDTGAGQGTFASPDGHTVTASWNFTCREHARRVPWDQDLTVSIMSLDGEAVPEASFVTSFRQRAPVKVYDVGGDSVVYTAEGHAPSRPDQERLLDRIRGLTGSSEVDGETRADVGDIVSLEGQMRELGDRIRARRRRVLDRLGIRAAAPALNVQAFYQTARLASSALRGTMEHWLGSVLGLPVARHDGRHRQHLETGSQQQQQQQQHHHRPGQHAHPEHADDGVVVSMQVDGQGGQRFFYYRDDADSSSTRLTPSPPPRNVTYLPLFATIFAFHAVVFLVLRANRQRMHSRRSRNHGNHVPRRTRRQTPRSTSANQQSTASLLCDSVRDLFRSRHVEVDEKTRMTMLGMMHDEDEPTSMADELASFLEAASLFSDVVAAQERAARGGDDDGRLPRFTEDVSPPAYEDEDEDGRGGCDDKRPDGC